MYIVFCTISPWNTESLECQPLESFILVKNFVSGNTVYYFPHILSSILFKNR